MGFILSVNICPSCRTRSGIQAQIASEKGAWIPGRARNDKMTMNDILLITTLAVKAEKYRFG